MLRRFISGLFAPKEIANYRNDKKIYTLGFFFLLVLILIIPNIIVLFQSGSLDYSDRALIRKVFYNEEIPYQISNNKLVITETDTTNVYDVTLYIKVVFTVEETFPVNVRDMNEYIILTENGVYHQTFLSKKLLFNYSDYQELKNFDFSGATTDNADFWSTVFTIMNNQFEIHRTTTIINNIIGNTIRAIIYLLLMSILIAVFQFRPLSGVEKFMKLWQLVIYILTPYAVGSLFAVLYGAEIFTIIGAIVSIIYGNILTQGIIQKRV